jgi:hypothetical protein
MANVSREEVHQMTNFMRALNGNDEQTFSEPAAMTKSLTETRQHMPLPVTADGTAEMKDVLTRFYAATDSAIRESASGDAELREAMMTERTTHGSRIGGWEIEMRVEGKRKFYDVIQSGGATRIAADLTLYEAAHGLVRILNEGGRINSPQAINLLRAEQDYASALNDAVLYKHYLVKHPNDRRSRIFEARYSAATHRAVNARDKVYTISERR